MSSRFEHAFITGASSGIGAHLSRRLANSGVEVVLASRNEQALESLAKQIAEAGGKAHVAVVDVTDTSAIQQVIQTWDRQMGGLDLVVANAGVGIMRPAHKLRWEDIQPVIDVNITGAFATLLAGLQCMVPRGRGTLAGVSSLAALRGLPTSGAYSASKAALSTFLETLRVDLRKKGIDVTDIRPGFVRTPMTEQNRFPMPMIMGVEEAAGIIAEGLEKGRAVVTFPWPLAQVMSVARRMPDGAWNMVAGKLR